MWVQRIQGSCVGKIVGTVSILPELRSENERRCGGMLEMIYSAKRLLPPEMLADGEYKGFHFYVLNLGTHPCAYVDVAETDLNGKHYNDIDIVCHCGLTYSREFLQTVDKKGWFIGWDYAHYCDFAGYELVMPENIRTNGKMWTTAEIVNECKEVIDQLVTAHPQRKAVKLMRDRLIELMGQSEFAYLDFSKMYPCEECEKGSE